MESEEVLVDVTGPVATVTLNRPAKLNALTERMQVELFDALRQLAPGDDIRVIRIRGAGRAFCPGYDLSPGDEPYAARKGGAAVRGDGLAEQGESSIARDRDRLRASIEQWLWMWSYRKPIVAQVHGLCLSGGLDLIGACDLVWAAEGTRFGHPAGRGMGIPRTIGMLSQKIGASATKELLFLGDLVDADEARRMGLVDRVVPTADLDVEVMRLCRRIALNSLDALTVHKHVVNRASELAGLRLAAYEGAEFDSILHESPTLARFAELSEAQGLKAALRWRDEPYERSDHSSSG